MFYFSFSHNMKLDGSWLSCQVIIKPSLCANLISKQWHTNIWPPPLSVQPLSVTQKALLLLVSWSKIVFFPASAFHSQARWALLFASWRIRSPKAVPSSHNMWSLICLIFSHLESMPWHQPCLLLSERHQWNSHWCAIIIAQMAKRV